MKLYAIPEVMEATSLGRTTVFSLIASGQLRSVKVGRRRLVPASALNEFITGLDPDPQPSAVA